jgi:hypothetical protein
MTDIAQILTTQAVHKATSFELYEPLAYMYQEETKYFFGSYEKTINQNGTR